MSEKDRSLKVIQWAQSQVGSMVGVGECWDLADRALLQAGARSSTKTGKGIDYVWGKPIAPAAAIAGDVIQLRNHVMTTTVKISITFEDQSGSDNSSEYEIRRPHHTAIVVENNGARGVVVFEQNVDPGGKVVQRNTLWLASTGGNLKTEVRMMKHESGEMRPAKVVETTTIRVTGKVWAYRPQARK